MHFNLQLGVGGRRGCFLARKPPPKEVRLSGRGLFYFTHSKTLFLVEVSSRPTLTCFLPLQLPSAAPSWPRRGKLHLDCIPYTAGGGDKGKGCPILRPPTFPMNYMRLGGLVCSPKGHLPVPVMGSPTAACSVSTTAPPNLQLEKLQAAEPKLLKGRQPLKMA